MSEALRVWLSQELNRRGWSHNELARKTGFSQTFVSGVLRGTRKPSINFCNRVAAALDMQTESLLRLAGILPPAAPASPADDKTLQQLVELARTMPLESRRELLKYAQFLLKNRPDG